MLILCVGLMAISVGYEAILFAFLGFPYTSLTFHVYILVGVWFATLLSILIYTKLPLVTLGMGWWWLIINSVIAVRYFNEEKSIPWFMYTHSFEILFIVASHIGYFVVLRKRNLNRFKS